MADQLDDLAAQADRLEAPPADAGDAGAPAAPGAPAPAAPGNYEACGFLLAGFREVACMLLRVESLKRTLDDANVERCARVLAPVADKYGLQLGGMLGGPEIAAAMVAGPVLWTAWRELDAELAARRRKPAELDTPPAAPAAAAPGAGDGG